MRLFGPPCGFLARAEPLSALAAEGRLFVPFSVLNFSSACTHDPIRKWDGSLVGLPLTAH